MKYLWMTALIKQRFIALKKGFVSCHAHQYSRGGAVCSVKTISNLLGVSTIDHRSRLTSLAHSRLEPFSCIRLVKRVFTYPCLMTQIHQVDLVTIDRPFVVPDRRMPKRTKEMTRAEDDQSPSHLPLLSSTELLG